MMFLASQQMDIFLWRVFLLGLFSFHLCHHHRMFARHSWHVLVFVVLVLDEKFPHISWLKKKINVRMIK
jgi:hypothetical protein